MEYSRRNFIKAAGVGAVAVTTTVSAVVSGAEVAAAAPKPSPLAIPDAMNRETNTFNINGKNYRAEYEARTTLWEVIAVKLGLTGTNRSCTRASWAACSVLICVRTLYTCHTLPVHAVSETSCAQKRLGAQG